MTKRKEEMDTFSVRIPHSLTKQIEDYRAKQRTERGVLPSKGAVIENLVRAGLESKKAVAVKEG